MKKILLSLGAIFAFGIASAQVNQTQTGNTNQGKVESNAADRTLNTRPADVSSPSLAPAQSGNAIGTGPTNATMPTTQTNTINPTSGSNTQGKSSGNNSNNNGNTGNSNSGTKKS